MLHQSIKNFPPKTITVKSDKNVLIFKEILKPVKSGETFFIYEYTKSKTKKGRLLGLLKEDLENLIKSNL